jgi:hypothetical protein
MAKVSLQRPCVVSLVGQREAAGMTQHMRVSLEAQLGGDASRLNHAGKAGRGERRAALRCEHERGLGILLAPEPAERTEFVTADR